MNPNLILGCPVCSLGKACESSAEAQGLIPICPLELFPLKSYPHFLSQSEVEIQEKFRSPQNISGASQQNSIAVFSWSPQTDLKRYYLLPTLSQDVHFTVFYPVWSGYTRM